LSPNEFSSGLFFCNHPSLGLKKVTSGHPGQVGAWQITFHSYLPNEPGPKQVICRVKNKNSKLRLAQGKQNLTCLFF